MHHCKTISYMVNLETCRKVLNDGGYDKEISNEEIRSLREFLYMIAQYQVEAEYKEEKLIA